MMTVISRIGSVFCFSLLLVTGCSAELPQAPTNQLINGPFTVTTEWQTIKFNQPLKTLPHIQRLEILLNMDNYESVNDIGRDQFDLIGDSYLSIKNNIPIRPEVIFINSKGYEFKATKIAVGYGKRKMDEYHFLAYGSNSEKGEFYFSKDTMFLAIKIRANTEFRTENLFWNAPRYYQAPNDTWKDVNESEIVTLK